MIELTCFLYDKKMQDDLGIEVPDIPAKTTILGSEIQSVRERMSDKDTEISKDTCAVYLKSGYSFTTGIGYNEMMEKWHNSLKASKK